MNQKQIITNYLKNLGNKDTRTNRRERVFPNVDKMTKTVNGKKVPLTEEEKAELKNIVFFNFFKLHINYGGEFEFFYGLRDDFFDEAVSKRILSYGENYFNTLTGKVKRFEKIITGNIKNDVAMVKRYNDELHVQLKAKMKEVRKSNRKAKKSTEGLISRCETINNFYFYNSSASAPALTYNI